MRSRYSAFVRGDLDYIESTWHPDHRSRDLAPDPRIQWLGLEIIDAREGEREATVEFEARLLLDGRVEALHEKSRFVRTRGRWLYISGEAMAPRFTPWKPGRNEECPCGSGRKFKRCCGGR